MHQQMQEPSAFSQHQAMERDDTGIVAPSNTFHQPLPTNFMDFPKVRTVQRQLVGCSKWGILLTNVWFLDSTGVANVNVRWHDDPSSPTDGGGSWRPCVQWSSRF